jgi:hypothetical protein
VEDLVQAASSQEKELAEKSLLVVDLQEQLANSGNFLFPFRKLQATLEGVKRGHTIAMEGLQTQL